MELPTRISALTVDDFKESVDKLLTKQSGFFSFLLAPESYLLAAGLLSSLVAILFLGLNAIALHCVITSCFALQDESNNLTSWLIFEGLTGFFLLTCVLSLMKYGAIRKQRSGKF